MKKIIMKSLLLASILPLAACSGGGGGGSSTPTSGGSNTSTSVGPRDEFITDPTSISYAMNELYTNGELLDTKNGFTSASSVKKMRAFSNGEYAESFTSYSSRQDIKLELYNDNAVRFANGYVFTLPFNEINVDYLIAKYRTVITFGDSILSVSFESSNPYTSLSNPWYTYASEWLMCHLLNNDYIINQGLTRTIPMNYKFSAANPYGDTTTKPGFDIYLFGIKIDKDTKKQIEYPYYNIAVVREKDDAKNFCLFVMKSKQERSELMNKIVESYSRISSKGTPRNYFYLESAKPVETWDAATRGFFDKLVNTEFVNWGVFSYSMPGTSDSLHKGQPGYDQTLAWSKEVQGKIESKWNHNFEIADLLIKKGLLKDKEFTCFPGFEEGLEKLPVKAYKCRNIITGCGLGGTIDFASLIVEELASKEKADEILNRIGY